MEYDDAVGTGKGNAGNITMAQLVKPRKNVLINSIEQVGEIGKKTVTETAKEVVDTFSFADYLGVATPKTSPEQERIQEDIKVKTENKQKESATPLSQEVVNQIAKDAQDLEQARKHLTDLVKSDEAKAIQDRREEERERVQAEIALEQQKAQERQRQQQANQNAEPIGKQKGKMGQARKKATTAPAQNFENKTNKGK